MVSSRLVIILCAGSALWSHSGVSQSLSYAALAGCYELTVSDWNKPMGGDQGYHTIPTSIRLDTTAALRGGKVVAPDISYPYGSAMRGWPRWDILRGDTVHIVWSNGFSPTILQLTKDHDQLRGWAEARSDAIPAGKPNWPRASVLGVRTVCPK
jgi:hypothetical protein